MSLDFVRREPDTPPALGNYYNIRRDGPRRRIYDDLHDEDRSGDYNPGSEEETDSERFLKRKRKRRARNADVNSAARKKKPATARVKRALSFGLKIGSRSTPAAFETPSVSSEFSFGSQTSHEFGPMLSKPFSESSSSEVSLFDKKISKQLSKSYSASTSSSTSASSSVSYTWYSLRSSKSTTSLPKPTCHAQPNAHNFSADTAIPEPNQNKGCKACFELGIDCPLLDKSSTYPCSNCVEDDCECELIIPPRRKRACQDCRRRRIRCSYRHGGDHSLPCEQCARRGMRCVAGPAST